MIPHNRTTTIDEDIFALIRVGKSGYLAQGPEVDNLEQDFCSYTGRKYAVAVGSGTAALRLSLLSRADLIPTVPAYSCVALANAGYHFPSGRLGVSDIFPWRLTLDPKDIGDAPESLAVVAVNTFGVKADVETLKKKRAGLVIEDCTHGFGDHKSDIEVLSLHATKLIGGAAGGIILTDNEETYEFCRNARDYDDKPASQYVLNDKLTDVHAALARTKLQRLPLLIEERAALAAVYLNHLDERYMVTPYPHDRTWYRFTICLEGQKLDAHLARAALHRRGIGAEIPVELWHPLKGQYPHTAKAYRYTLSLPLYPNLSRDAVARIAKEVNEVLS